VLCVITKFAAPFVGADMSIKAVKWALSVKDIDATNKLALIAIAECHNDKSGDCFPSQKYVAEVIGLTERPTRVRLNKLEADGFFTRKPRYDTTTGKRTSDGYKLHFEVTSPTTGRQASDSDDWTLPAEATAASVEAVLPAEAPTGSERLSPNGSENLLPAVSEVLPADTAAGTNPFNRKIEPDVAGIRLSSKRESESLTQLLGTTEDAPIDPATDTRKSHDPKLEVLRERAAKIGYKLRKRGDRYGLIPLDDEGLGSWGPIETIPSMLDGMEGKASWQMYTACGMRIDGANNSKVWLAAHPGATMDDFERSLPPLEPTGCDLDQSASVSLEETF
jgi:hypothetical protein